MICYSKLGVLMVCTWAAILLTFDFVVCADLGTEKWFIACSDVCLR